MRSSLSNSRVNCRINRAWVRSMQRSRLRPIIMTSLAFNFGVMPLAISNGAGSASQHAIGTGVIGGMLTATFLAIFMIPMFFVVIRAKFGGEQEDPDEALVHYNQHHPNGPQDGGSTGGSAHGSTDEGSGKDGH